MASRYNIIYAMTNQGNYYVKSVSETKQTIEFTQDIYQARRFPLDFYKASAWVDKLTTFPISLQNGYCFAMETVC